MAYRAPTATAGGHGSAFPEDNHRVHFEDGVGGDYDNLGTVEGYDSSHYGAGGLGTSNIPEGPGGGYGTGGIGSRSGAGGLAATSGYDSDDLGGGYGRAGLGTGGLRAGSGRDEYYDDYGADDHHGVGGAVHHGYGTGGGLDRHDTYDMEPEADLFGLGRRTTASGLSGHGQDYHGNINGGMAGHYDDELYGADGQGRDSESHDGLYGNEAQKLGSGLHGDIYGSHAQRRNPGLHDDLYSAGARGRGSGLHDDLYGDGSGLERGYEDELYSPTGAHGTSLPGDLYGDGDGEAFHGDPYESDNLGRTGTHGNERLSSLGGGLGRENLPGLGGSLGGDRVSGLGGGRLSGLGTQRSSGLGRPDELSDLHDDAGLGSTRHRTSGVGSRHDSFLDDRARDDDLYDVYNDPVFDESYHGNRDHGFDDIEGSDFDPQLDHMSQHHHSSFDEPPLTAQDRDLGHGEELGFEREFDHLALDRDAGSRTPLEDDLVSNAGTELFEERYEWEPDTYNDYDDRYHALQHAYEVDEGGLDRRLESDAWEVMSDAGSHRGSDIDDWEYRVKRDPLSALDGYDYLGLGWAGPSTSDIAIYQHDPSYYIQGGLNRQKQPLDYATTFADLNGYGRLGNFSTARLSLPPDHVDEMLALRDLRQYEDALRLDTMLNEQERRRRWRDRLAWEEMSADDRKRRWQVMNDEERWRLGLGPTGFWGMRYLGVPTTAFNPNGNQGAIPTTMRTVVNNLRTIPRAVGGYGGYRSMHGNTPYYGPTRQQVASLYDGGRYRGTHYPLSSRVSNRFSPIFTSLVQRRAPPRMVSAISNRSRAIRANRRDFEGTKRLTNSVKMLELKTRLDLAQLRASLAGATPADRAAAEADIRQIRREMGEEEKAVLREKVINDEADAAEEFREREEERLRIQRETAHQREIARIRTDQLRREDMMRRRMQQQEMLEARAREQRLKANEIEFADAARRSERALELANIHREEMRVLKQLQAERALKEEERQRMHQLQLYAEADRRKALQVSARNQAVHSQMLERERMATRQAERAYVNSAERAAHERAALEADRFRRNRAAAWEAEQAAKVHHARVLSAQSIRPPVHHARVLSVPPVPPQVHRVHVAAPPPGAFTAPRTTPTGIPLQPGMPARGGVYPGGFRRF